MLARALAHSVFPLASVYLTGSKPVHFPVAVPHPHLPLTVVEVARAVNDFAFSVKLVVLKRALIVDS